MNSSNECNMLGKTAKSPSIDMFLWTDRMNGHRKWVSIIFPHAMWRRYAACTTKRKISFQYRMSLKHIASFDGNREVPLPDLSGEKVFPAKDWVKALFDPSMKWQLVEAYGVDSFTEQDDGSLLFEHEYADDEGLISWMLSCRDKVTVLEPERIRAAKY